MFGTSRFEDKKMRNISTGLPVWFFNPKPGLELEHRYIIREQAADANAAVAEMTEKLNQRVSQEIPTRDYHDDMKSMNVPIKTSTLLQAKFPNITEKK